MIIYIVGIVAYIFNLIIYKKISFLIYQLITATIFLLTLSYAQTLDITLPLYIVFAIIPLLKHIKVKGMINLLFVVYFIGILSISVVLNGFTSSISSFLICLVGIGTFVLFFNNYTFSSNALKLCNKNKILVYLIIFAICETILGIIASSLTTLGTRLMLNFHCTVGIVSIAGMLMVGLYLYLDNTNKTKIMGFLFSIYFVFWTYMSGTRGYLFFSIALLALYFLIYMDTIPKMLFIGLSIIFIVFLLTNSNVYERIMDVTRLNSDTGRRNSEDLFVLNYMPKSFFHSLFGYGFGRQVGTLPGVEDVLVKVSDTQYTYEVMHTITGFHNLFSTILYTSGIVGVVLLLLVFINIFINIRQTFNDIKIRLILYTFIIMFIFMSWYRRSATSGILEFAVFTYVFNCFKYHEARAINYNTECIYE